MVLAVVGAILIFVAVSSVVLWAVGPKGAAGEARLSRLGSPSRANSLDAPFGDRVVMPVVDGVSKLVMNVLPHSFVARVRRQLITAGRPMTTQTFFAVVMVTGVVLPGAVLTIAVARSGALPALAAGGVGVFTLLGLVLPFLWLSRRARGRKLAIWKSLPDAFDLITVSVEAGLGLDSALRHVSERMRGPLTDEIRQMLREVGLGRARREALEEMAERVDVKEVATFVNAVVQAEQLGTSLGRVLRAQAAMLRVQRRQRVEEMSRKAPVKLVFPLVLCIMPSFFVVTLGPIGIKLVTVLGGD